MKKTLPILMSFGLLFSANLKNEAISFPSTVISSEGNKINVGKLTEGSTVIIITIKSPSCPVCQTQLIRIGKQLNTFNKCNVTFLVLSPGTSKEVHQVKLTTGFPFPFIPDDDLSIAKALGLLLNPQQILPSIIVLNDNLTINWIQKGRNNIYFGDDELYDYLDCDNWI